MANASRSSTPKSTTASYDHYWPLTGHLHHPSYATHCPPSTGTSTPTPTTPASQRQPETSRHIHEFMTPSCGLAPQDRLQVAELSDTGGCKLTAVAGPLDAAKRQLRVGHRHAVDGD